MSEHRTTTASGGDAPTTVATQDSGLRPQVPKSAFGLQPSASPEAPAPAACSVLPASKPPVHFWLALVIAALIFAKPLLALANFALHSSVYSHVLIIPFLTLYLLRSLKERWQYNVRPNLRLAALPAVIGAGLVGTFWAVRGAGRSLAPEDSLALTTLGFVFLIYSVAAAFVAQPSLRRAAFPLAFLLFLAPFPSAVLSALEAFLQHGSAFTADWMLSLSGMPLIRDGTSFRLPGFQMEVAPECSGIRSTLVLFITSLVAGYLFLRSPSKRAILTAAVIPLALLRNGFRIFTIGQLCVNVSPTMIDSPIHHKGGPIFFALSLIPFFLLLIWLRRTGRRPAPAGLAGNAIT